MAFKKKLHKLRPGSGAGNAEQFVQSRYTRQRTRRERSDPASIERGVRQLLADKVSGHLVGVWLLVAEHLRLGTWDLLRTWTGKPADCVEPRLAMQVVNEAALCTTGIRRDRTLTNRGGFELANGLPFLGSDPTIHQLLASHTVSDAHGLQVALGKLRRAGGDFRGKVLAVDPHRMRSYSKRQMRMHCKKSSEKPVKMAQTFWLLDADTEQPVCFTTATASRTVAQATPELLDLAARILVPQAEPALVVADIEHFNAELLDHVAQRKDFELLVPMSGTEAIRKQLASIPAKEFTPRWAGFATAKRRYSMKRGRSSFYQYVQRTGERPENWRYKAFVSTTDRDEVSLLTEQFPQRWHIEEYFNANQALGWKRGGTMNLNIRFGQMTLALLAQAAIHQLRTRLGEPFNHWDANHLAKDLFQGLDGDVRVKDDTIIVTYYNAPKADQLRLHYQGLPDKLAQQHIDPGIPWLYGFKLDFRFR
jgi:Transposase DDE domain